MANEPQSDEEIIAREQREYKGSMLFGLLASVVAVALIFAIYAADRHGLFLHFGVTHHAIENFGAYGVLGILLLFLLPHWVKQYRLPNEAYSERILRKQVDRYQKRSRPLYIVLAVIILCSAYVTARKSGPGPDTFVLDAVVFSFLVCFGAGFTRDAYRKVVLHDEVTKALRARAIQIGYLVSIFMFGAAYLVFWRRPDLGLTVFPMAIALAVAVPALLYVFFDWRAGRDG